VKRRANLRCGGNFFIRPLERVAVPSLICTR
jgi:hypothetical protein